MNIERLKEELEETKGVVGSGTVACRLWNTLNSVVSEFAELEQQLATEKKRVQIPLTAWQDARLQELFVKNEQLEAQLSAAQERERWIPVTERLPRQLDVVDVQIRHGYQTDVMQNDGGDHWIDGEGNCWEAGTVTHWRYRL